MAPIHRRTVVLMLTAGAIGSWAQRFHGFRAEGLIAPPASAMGRRVGEVTFDSTSVTFDSTLADFGSPLLNETLRGTGVDAVERVTGALQAERAAGTGPDNDLS